LNVSVGLSRDSPALARSGWANFVFAFHDDEEIGPKMLARIAKKNRPQKAGRSLTDSTMKQFLATLQVSTQRKRELVDITEQVREEVRRAGISNGTCALYAQGATAALMIQENDDPNITLDVLDCLEGIAPQGRWRHDRVDDNGSAHIQAGLVGPSEVIPIRDGSLALSTWQNIFLCDFDGPRNCRTVIVTIQGE
jgi:secondary thiamine-phosphate synthase enzyme